MTVNHADLEQHPVVTAIFLKVKEPLFGRASHIRPEDDFPRPRHGAGKRMDPEEERIVHAVEFNRVSARRIDDVWVSENRNRMAANPVEIVNTPGFTRWRRGEQA